MEEVTSSRSSLLCMAGANREGEPNKVLWGISMINWKPDFSRLGAPFDIGFFSLSRSLVNVNVVNSWPWQVHDCELWDWGCPAIVSEMTHLTGPFFPFWAQFSDSHAVHWLWVRNRARGGVSSFLLYSLSTPSVTLIKIAVTSFRSKQVQQSNYRQHGHDGKVNWSYN